MEKTKSSDNVPEKKFNAGAVSVAVWKNSGKDKTGQDTEYRSITLQRSYKDKNGQWQNTNSLRVNDLPKAALVLTKAYEYLVLRDSGTQTSSEEDSMFEEIVM